MAKTYILGTFGGSGSSVRRAGGQLFEAMDNGVCTSLREAKKAAAELAVEFSRDAESGSAQVAIVVDMDDDCLPELLTIATATRGNKRVSWS